MARTTGNWEWERAIIAMKGHPFTRKTEFATAIAKSLRCPLFSTENILHGRSPPLSPEEENAVFSDVCELARIHLDSRISNHVVIDSPLSSKSQFDQLMDLAFSQLSVMTQVIIIECKPMNNYSWKLKFKRHLDENPLSKAKYEGKNWEDVQKHIRDHPGYDDGTLIVQPLRPVSKLVVNPLTDCPNYDTTVYSYAQKDMHCDLVEAVKCMIERGGPSVIIYHQWLQQSWYVLSLLGDDYCRQSGHDIVPNSKVVEHEATDCKACQKQIFKSDAYCLCLNCDVALHMECAQKPVHIPGQKEKGRYDSESMLAQKSICNNCKKTGFAASDKTTITCLMCLFDQHIESCTYPTIFKHFDTEEHFLTVLLKRDRNFGHSEFSYPCIACGQRDGTYMYLCKDHGVAYCYECVNLPRRVENEHGGHNHILSLRFTSEVKEDYNCQKCLQSRDPTLWFYSCEACPGYNVHPHCVRKLRTLYYVFQDRYKRERAKVKAKT